MQQGDRLYFIENFSKKSSFYNPMLWLHLWVQKFISMVAQIQILLGQKNFLKGGIETQLWL